MNIVWTKVYLSIFLSCIIWFLCLNKSKIETTLKLWSLSNVFVLSVLLLRIVPFILAFFVFDFPKPSDINYYWDHSVPVLDGKVVYRDFFCPYAPLFPYVLAFSTKLWHDWRVISALMMLAEIGILWLTVRSFKWAYTQEELLFRTILYLLMPASMVLSALSGQEDIWMWFFAVIAYRFSFSKNNSFWFGFVLGTGQLFTKVILILPTIPIFLLARNRPLFILGLSIIGVPTLAILYFYTNLEFLQPIQESNIVRSPNLGSVLNPLLFDSISLGARAWNWIGLVITSIVASTTIRHRTDYNILAVFSWIWVVTFGTMMVVQQSAYSNYIFIYLMPLMFSMVNLKSKKEILILLIFNFSCVSQPSLWWRMGQPIYKSPADIFSRIDYTTDYLLQLIIVACVLYYIYSGFQYLKKSNPITPV